MDIYIALVHHPVRNKRGETVATAVTNLDIHDLARAARTYSVAGYWLVTPIAQQRSLVERIVSHWTSGEGRRYNPVRSESFELVRVAPSLQAVITDIQSETGAAPVAVATGAAFEQGDKTTSYEALRERLATDQGSCLILFGTGWGLIDSVVQSCDLELPPIRAVSGRDGWNHLPVRAAVAIILDRLLGDR